MRNRWRKVASILLGMACLTGCTFVGAGSESSESVEENPFGFEQIYQGQEQKTLEPNESFEINVGVDIQEKNYLRLQLKTNVNLVGYIYYEENTNAAKTNKEKIYIEQGATEFTTFLDAFRVGAQGVFQKKLTKISLQNVEETIGQVSVLSVDISDRTYDRTEELYIDDGHIKVGTSLAYGGSIRHIEKLNASVVEYIDENGDVRIEQGVEKENVDVVSEEVNLVNIYDLGREIQQSYYSAAKEENGYAPEDKVLYEGDLLYNPVQAGSAGSKESQIIDYRATETEIYVKVKPLEWFLNNTLSDSYMENRYYFGEEGVLLVSNRFVNFSQFTDMKDLIPTAQETPAVYIVQPLNYFYCETLEGTIKDNNLSPQPTSQSKGGLFDGVESNYHYFLEDRLVVNDWLAFVNDKNWGVGMYMPNAKYYTASRGIQPISYQALENHRASAWWNGSLKGYVPSAYVSNYNYCCPVSHGRMLDFVPFEYEYAIFVGTIYDMREAFTALKESGTMTNEGVYAWDK